MFNVAALKENLERLTPRRNFFVAYSGGLDSQVLLSSLVALRRAAQTDFACTVSAIHINHGLSDNAVVWAESCADFCRTEQVPFFLREVDVLKVWQKGESKEEVARRLRYQAFAEILPPDATLLTAHHLDDQAETLLLQLLRGSGLKGLASMPEQAPFGKGELLRPLLHFSRAELKEYAQKEHLSWIEDESNLAVNFDRNYLRAEVFPQLKKHFPGVLTTFERAARHAAEADFLLQQLAATDYQMAVGSVAATLSRQKLLLLDAARQRNLLRYFIGKFNFPLPSDVKLKQLQQDLLLSRVDASPCITFADVEVRRFGDDIYILKAELPFDVSIILPWDLKSALILPAGLGRLMVTVKQQGVVLPTNVTVRFRSGGERIKIAGKEHSSALKKLLQEWRVPPWQRERLPLIYFGDRLVAVVGFAVADEAAGFEFAHS